MLLFFGELDVITDEICLLPTNAWGRAILFFENKGIE
jgi:hypothetical protein